MICEAGVQVGRVERRLSSIERHKKDNKSEIGGPFVTHEMEGAAQNSMQDWLTAHPHRKTAGSA